MKKRPNKKPYNIACIGSGYVGLVTGTCLANIGHNVILVDRDAKKIAALKKGRIPIFEPGLAELVLRNVRAGRLEFTTHTAHAVRTSDVVFIAVNTPQKKNGEANLSYVKSATHDIARASDAYKVVVNKSTVPVTTGRAVARLLTQYNSRGIDFDVVSNPEFLREGTAIYDFMKADRIVLGVENERAEKIMREIYRPIPAQILVTDLQSAELIKYASNSFLAGKISFINAVARICEEVGANIDDVARGMGMDKRISAHFLKAGIGWGGSCFQKDVSAFRKIGERHGNSFPLLKEIEAVNRESRMRFVKKVIRAIGGKPRGKTIALWGLSFKPNTDDMRDAPSVTIIEELQKKGVRINSFDPAANQAARAILGNSVRYAKDKYEALRDADALVIVTDWDEFKKPDWTKIQSLLKDPVIIDGRNMFIPNAMERRGFVYHSIGRG